MPAFYLDTTPVTNAAYQEFIADGGYDDPRWWTPAGWDHRQRAGPDRAAVLAARGRPAGCATGSGSPSRCRPPSRSMHVCWYEADAYARWAGRRLPTEAEWEKAARFDPATGRSRRFPWGDEDPTAGPGQPGPAAPAARPGGQLPGGRRAVRRAAADRRRVGVDLQRLPALPGLPAWPYQEYSEVFFGPEYKVLRGGSFAVGPVACRGTFRNWDYPIRRQIFAGFRTARDARPRGTPPAPGVTPPDVPPSGLPGPAGHPAVAAHRPAVRAGSGSPGRRAGSGTGR